MGWTSNDLRIEMMNAEAAVEAIKNYAIANASKYEALNMASIFNLPYVHHILLTRNFCSLICAYEENSDLGFNHTSVTDNC